MNPGDKRKQREMLDAAYGAPGLKEQQYFEGGGMGPPSQAMEAQQHPFGREEDAFNNGPKQTDELWFIDQLEGGKATVMQGERRMQIPATMLPKGAAEGRFFDPKTGQISDRPDDATEGRRRGLMDDEGAEVEMGFGG